MSTLSLPSRVAPSSHSRSAGRPGRDESGDRTFARSHLPSTPRIPSSRSTHPEGYLRDRPDTTSSHSSSTTSSTSGLSFLDRMKAPSSHTSLEDYQPPRGDGGGGTSYRGKRTAQREREGSDEDDRRQRPTALITGHGADIWSRVSAVASKLTVDVSHAWQKSILADGEETPPGEESRLTKAMKAYHLDRARSPADLPPWLFTDRERGVAQNTRDYENRFHPDRTLEHRERGGLRDVYDRAAAATSTPPDESGDSGGSRAANRLKAIRDARRAAKTASEHTQLHTEDRYSGEANRTRRSGQRVGLPARPGRMRQP